MYTMKATEEERLIGAPAFTILSGDLIYKKKKTLSVQYVLVHFLVVCTRLIVPKHLSLRTFTKCAKELQHIFD